MDLRRELLAVLDNPSRFWDSLVENLANEPRICLLTLATYSTPIDIVEWQQAVARVSVGAAVKFEASIRVLDDSLVTIGRDMAGKTAVRFRNPSVEEFVAAQLDRNVGFATTVATHEPSLGQVKRLVQLGTARKVSIKNMLGGKPSYGNLRAALIDDPSVLSDRLLALLPENSRWTSLQDEVTLLLVQLAGEGRLSRMSGSEHLKQQLSTILLNASFNTHAELLYKLLDDYRHANTVALVLGDRFEEFYGMLAESASSIIDFDSLVNLDQALDRSPEYATWAGKFERLNEHWLETDIDADSVESNRDYYEKIVNHLDLEDRSGLEAWQEAVEKAARESDERDDDDDSWRESESYQRASTRQKDNASHSDLSGFLREDRRERGKIDALFGSLTESKSRE